MQTEQGCLPLLKTECSHPRHEIAGLLLMGLTAMFFAVAALLLCYVMAYAGLPVSMTLLVCGVTQTVLTLLTTVMVPDGREVFQILHDSGACLHYVVV